MMTDPATAVAPLTGTDRQADGPLVVTPSRPGLDICQWIAEDRPHVQSLLARHRALLFRGFAIDTPDRFQAMLGALQADLLDYTERSTPRSTVDGKVYTSTEYPKTHEIPMHNENAYSRTWPRRILFCCLQPAEQGGETPIADSRAVYAALDPALRAAFERRQVMYVRNYGQGVDLSWQEAFQTDDPARVEAYCRASDIACEWFDDGEGLHTHQIRPAALRHVPTDERVWFNQAHLFHVSSLEPSLRESLTALFPPERLPRHACYGDGGAIEDAALDEIRRAYARVRTPVSWARGDVLLLDNLFYAHGRLPFSGVRQVIVAMDTVGGADVAPL